MLTFLFHLNKDPKGLSIGGLMVITKSLSLTVSTKYQLISFCIGILKPLPLKGILGTSSSSSSLFRYWRIGLLTLCLHHVLSSAAVAASVQLLNPRSFTLSHVVIFVVQVVLNLHSVSFWKAGN